MNTASDKRTDDLIRKIRALRAKAEGTNNEHEAAAFAAKVAAMLAEHGLEEASLRQEEQSGIDVERTDAWKASPARRAMAAALCRLYMVKAIMGRSPKDPWTLVGRRSNIVMVQEMSDYLIKTTVRLSNEYRKREGRTNAEMIDFRRGCFARLAERLRELREAQTRDAPVYTPQGNPGNLPALWVTEGKLIDAKVYELFPNLIRVKARGIHQGSSAMAGRRAGDGVSLSPQIGGSRGGTLIGRG